jgi:hypothetical protein
MMNKKEKSMSVIESSYAEQGDYIRDICLSTVKVNPRQQEREGTEIRQTVKYRRRVIANQFLRKVSEREGERKPTAACGRADA